LSFEMSWKDPEEINLYGWFEQEHRPRIPAKLAGCSCLPAEDVVPGIPASRV